MNPEGHLHVKRMLRRAGYSVSRTDLIMIDARFRYKPALNLIRWVHKYRQMPKPGEIEEYARLLKMIRNTVKAERSTKQ